MLYIHIPFCEVLCPFCSFHRDRYHKEITTRYFRALDAEIRSFEDRGYDFSAIYVGGGTPTVYPERLADTLALVRDLFSVEQVSVETNPDHLRDDVLAMLEDAGVNRLSVGVQSFDDRLLVEMDRYDKYGSGGLLVERLLEAWGRFDTLNADMIFNLAHQDLTSLRHDVHLLTEVAKVDR